MRLRAAPPRGDRQQADDLVQEALPGALQSRSRYRGDARVRTWPIGILRNKTPDLVRRRCPCGGWNLEEVGGGCRANPQDAAGRWCEPPSAWPAPDGLLERDDLCRGLQECLQRLPPRQARLFHSR